MILTTDANGLMMAIHERMPVVIPPESDVGKDLRFLGPTWSSSEMYRSQ